MSVQDVTDLLPKRPRDWLLVSEQFLTHQGEGPSTGQLAYFVRLGACGLSCKWCDTAYTWAYSDRRAQMTESKKQYSAKDELRRVPLDRIVDDVLTQPARLIVFSGGEPLLQADTLCALISRINEEVRPHRFEIETAGTESPYALNAYENLSFNVSPKLASSGNSEVMRYRPNVLRELAALDSQFKFVVDTRDSDTARNDLSEIEKIVGEIGIPNHRIWLMPCGTTSYAVQMGLQWLAPAALDHEWNLSGREHVLIYGNQRGH